LPSASRTAPPNAAVVWYQYVDSPSAAANGMFRGCSTTPVALTCRRAAVYSSIVAGAGLAPARANISVLTVVTMNDAS
jgi:hypothetical protein